MGDGEIYMPPEDWSARRRRRKVGSRLFFAIFLIVAGTLLFLGNIGLLPVQNIWDYWPVILIVVGGLRLLHCKSAGGRIFSVLLVVFGSLSLLFSLGILHINAHDDSWPLSLLLIAIGLATLIKVLDRDMPRKPAIGFQKWWRTGTDNTLKDTAIFAEIKRKIESPNFEGGTANSVFGSVVLNLRRSQIAVAGKTATVEANAVFGAVKIRIPEDWRVDMQGIAVLGNYSDKTIPMAMPASETPTLTVTGYAVFGSVEIEN